MKITLVNPHYEEPRVLRFLGLPSIPLGFGCVAASLECAGHDVEVIDAFGEKLTTERTIERLREAAPDVTGISCVTCNVDIGRRIAEAAKQFSMVVMGGTHPSLIPESVADACDVVVIGEGEESFPELLSGKPRRAIRGIAFREGGHLVGTPSRPQIADLDSVPFPARHLFPMDRYKQFGEMSLATMMTSRGCPMRCSYCTISRLYPSWRGRSPENVVDEMELLIRDYHVKGISLVDEDFLYDLDRAEAICERILTRRLKFWWGMQTRADRLPDLSFLRRMKKAGCEFALFGIESVSEQTMKDLNRHLSIAAIRRAFRVCRDAGMRTAGSAILGFPGETEADALATVAFVQELDPDYVFFGVPTPFPGTKFHLDCQANGWIKETDLLKYTIMSPIVETQSISLVDAQRILHRAYRSFYFRPWYLIRRLCHELSRLDWHTLCGFMKWSLASFFDTHRW